MITLLLILNGVVVLAVMAIGRVIEGIRTDAERAADAAERSLVAAEKARRIARGARAAARGAWQVAHQVAVNTEPSDKVKALRRLERSVPYTTMPTHEVERELARFRAGGLTILGPNGDPLPMDEGMRSHNVKVLQNELRYRRHYDAKLARLREVMDELR